MGLLKDSEEQIIEAAKNGTTGRELAKMFGVCPSTISNIFRKHSFKPPTGRRPTCELNHAAFDTITPASAYWMGFLCADGSFQDHGPGTGAPQIVLGLARKDRSHIEKFRSFLGSTHTIRDTVHKTSKGYHDGKGGLASVFRVRSKPLTEALARRGLVAKGAARFPTDEIADNPDFWRGEVDGDGTVYLSEHSKVQGTYRYPGIFLCGHMPLLERYQAFLLRRGISANITDTASGIFQIRLIGSGALAVLRLLYGNATVALDRKLSIARDLLEEFDH